MKITEMVYSTVVAFDPKRQPWKALIALLLFLIALVSLAYIGGSNAAVAFLKFR